MVLGFWLLIGVILANEDGWLEVDLKFGAPISPDK